MVETSHTATTVYMYHVGDASDVVCVMSRLDVHNSMVHQQLSRGTSPPSGAGKGVMMPAQPRISGLLPAAGGSVSRAVSRRYNDMGTIHLYMHTYIHIYTHIYM